MELFPLLAVVLLALIFLSGCAVLFLLYQIFQRQGGFLLRLDAIEGQLAQRSPKQQPFAGLPVGEAFERFTLPDLEGTPKALEGFRGKKVLLVNWSPTCGYCAKAAPELAKLKDDFQTHNVELLLASYGDNQGNRELASKHGLENSVLLREGSPAIQAFETVGTPSAYLLDEEGRVARSIAIGVGLVPALGRYAVGKATEAELVPR